MPRSKESHRLYENKLVSLGLNVMRRNEMRTYFASLAVADPNGMVKILKLSEFLGCDTGHARNQLLRLVKRGLVKRQLIRQREGELRRAYHYRIASYIRIYKGK